MSSAPMPAYSSVSNSLASAARLSGSWSLSGEAAPGEAAVVLVGDCRGNSGAAVSAFLPTATAATAGKGDNRYQTDGDG